MSPGDWDEETVLNCVKGILESHIYFLDLILCTSWGSVIFRKSNNPHPYETNLSAYVGTRFDSSEFH